jgi:hypothetical protein
MNTRYKTGDRIVYIGNATILNGIIIRKVGRSVTIGWNSSDWQHHPYFTTDIDNGIFWPLVAKLCS